MRPFLPLHSLAARRSEQQDVGALAEPGVPRRQRHHLSLGDHRHGLEVEGGERLSGWQACLGHVALNAPAAAIGEFMPGKSGKEAGRRPALLVGLGGELGPHQLDAPLPVRAGSPPVAPSCVPRSF